MRLENVERWVMSDGILNALLSVSLSQLIDVLLIILNYCHYFWSVWNWIHWWLCLGRRKWWTKTKSKENEKKAKFNKHHLIKALLHQMHFNSDDGGVEQHQHQKIVWQIKQHWNEWIFGNDDKINACQSLNNPLNHHNRLQRVTNNEHFWRFLFNAVYASKQWYGLFMHAVCRHTMNTHCFKTYKSVKRIFDLHSILTNWNDERICRNRMQLQIEQNFSFLTSVCRSHVSWNFASEQLKLSHTSSIQTKRMEICWKCRNLLSILERIFSFENRTSFRSFQFWCC